MRSSRLPVVTMIVASLLLVACASATSPSLVRTPSPNASPMPPTALPPTKPPPTTSEATGTPIAAIDHATGPTAVVLRYDAGGDYDYGICELCGGWGEFAPGPEFTLYGDGTVIVRNGRPHMPSADGPIVRAHPFRWAHVDEDQVQSVLRFAIGNGGLGNARERYETSTDTDDPGYAVLTIRAGGLDKRVEILGSGAHPFEALRDHLLDIAQRSGIPTLVWVPDRYWGLLIEVSSWIGHGVLPDPVADDIVPWPWPSLAVVDFGLQDLGEGRRVMSPKEAAVLRLSDNGGVVQRIFLLGPDGKTIYSFSLWPMLPDEQA